jgi:hypothetical protein
MIVATDKLPISRLNTKFNTSPTPSTKRSCFPPLYSTLAPGQPSYSENMNAHAFELYSEDGPCHSPASHDRTDLLIEVDFKWLMAGFGWLVDPDRLKIDPVYAKECLQFAYASNCESLQDCADCLREELGVPLSDGPTYK